MKALFPISGDPFHLGHADIVRKALDFYDEVVVGLGVNPNKKYMFSPRERVQMAKNTLRGEDLPMDRITVTTFSGLTIHYAYENNIDAIVKGIRNSKDFEYEKAIRDAESTQNLDIPTHFLQTDGEMAKISSSTIKALLREQGYIHTMVHPTVKQALEGRMNGQYLINLTGGIAMGKTTLANEMVRLGRNLNYDVHNIELDHIVHKMYDGTYKEPIYAQIRKEIGAVFGKDVLNEDGTIDRKVLGSIVFNYPVQMAILNNIIETPLRIAISKEIYGKKGLIIINSALIAESNMTYMGNNNTIICDITPELQKMRLEERGLTEAQIKTRLETQYTNKKKFKLISENIAKAKVGTVWMARHNDVMYMLNQIIEALDIYGEMRFNRMWRSLSLDGTPFEAYRKLQQIYIHPSRHYHNLQHIVKGLSRPSEPIQKFAWFYHDAVINQNSKVSEEKSAEMALRVWKFAMGGSKDSDLVYEHIMRTKHNSTKPFRITDLDLLIFGAKESEYDQYSKNIRKEYSWVPEDVYREGRKAVLEKFLRRENLYTEWNKHLEKDARANLQRELKSLG